MYPEAFKIILQSSCVTLNVKHICQMYADHIGKARATRGSLLSPGCEWSPAAALPSCRLLPLSPPAPTLLPSSPLLSHVCLA